MRIIWGSLLALVVMMGVLGLSACIEPDEFTMDQSAVLSFSLDTLRFDTVFTAVGSATRSFRVYNKQDKAIKISQVYLEAGDRSKFRVNVDGLPLEEARDVVIWAQDSIWVFVEVTVDPDEPLSISPFVIEELLTFETNGNVQQVQLDAWGQNANYIPDRFNRGDTTLLDAGGGVIRWDDPKPYVIYGVLLIYNGTLELTPGTRVHVHGGIAESDLFGIFNDGILFVLESGRIRSLGTVDNPVIIQGDRLEETFQQASGQWYGVLLSKGSRGNVFEHTTIKNSFVGIYADSASRVRLDAAQIYNTQTAGLIGWHSQIDADNTLIYNSAGDAVRLLHGGRYTFRHSTVASYGFNAGALSMNNFWCYDENPLPGQCMNLSTHPLQVRIINSIIAGSRQDEISLSDIANREQPGLFDVRFDHSVVVVDELLTQNSSLYSDFFTTICNPCAKADFADDLFMDTSEDDYRLDTMSIAKGIGQALPTVPTDLEGNHRDAQMPDAGCYEAQH